MKEELAFWIARAAENRLFIEALTAATAFLIGSIALRLGQRALRDERWIGYFGWGFLIFGVQYAVPTGMGVANRLGSSPDPGSWLTDGLPLLCSAANNVCFLAAGISLLKLEWKPSRRYWVIAVGVGLVSAAADGFQWFAPWNRSVDGVFSAVAAAALGVAFFGNASPKRRRAGLSVAYFGAFLYVVLSLGLVAVPWFAGRSFEVNDQVRKALPAALSGNVAFAYDTALIAAALALKVFLALGGFSLVLRALVIISPREQHAIFQQVSRGELEYFSGPGIVRAISEGLSADRATVFIRLPGQQSRVLRWRWPERPDDEVDAPAASDGREGAVLAQGNRVTEQNLVKSDPSGGPPITMSLIVEPLIYHGTITGCLALEWNSKRGFTKTSLQQAARLVESLGPAVEARRMLAALLYWGEKRQESQIETRPPGYRSLAETLARLVHETLSPISAGLELEVGFGPVWAVVGDAGSLTGLRGELPSEGLVSAVKECSGRGSERTQAIDLKFAEVKIGKLILLWPEIQAGTSSVTRVPAVHSDEQHLQVFVPLIVNAVLRSVDTAFFGGLSDLQVKLLEARRADQWFAAIEWEVRLRGPQWVLATLVDGRILGDSGIAADLRVSGFKDLDETIWNKRLEEPIHGAFNVVRLRLPKSRATLWLGASNPNLGPELAPGWPWQGFLERLAATADASLFDLTNEAELRRVKGEARKIEGLVRATVDSGTFIHEMRNIARNFSFAAQSLGEAKRRGELSATIDIEADIDAMVRSADRLYGLAEAVLRPREVDNSGETWLEDLVQEIKDLFAPVLRSHFIDIKTKIPEGLKTSVPAYVLHTALKTLVSNSVDAIAYHGLIRIEAEAAGPVVRIEVADSGPGIDSADPQSVFALGNSTKGTTGLGLFLVRNLLENAGARIQLTSWQPGQTTFILELPALLGKE